MIGYTMHIIESNLEKIHGPTLARPVFIHDDLGGTQLHVLDIIPGDGTGQQYSHLYAKEC